MTSDSERSLEGRAVAVFGSSEPIPGSAAYEDARHLGRLLAARGARVVNGGYGGVMEAASRGAREGGGAALGVTCSAFSDRTPNAWLGETRIAGDLFERTRLLIELSDAFIIMPGKSGTLAELAFVLALDRAGALGAKPVVLCGAIWPALIDAIAAGGALEPEQGRILSFARDPEQALGEVMRRLR